jgi:hypothetical protein
MLLGGVGLLGGVLQGVGAAQGRMDNAASLDATAEGIDRDIRSERESSAYEVARTTDAVKRTLGSQRAGFTANGISLSGSAADVIESTATEGDLDIAAIRWNSKSKQDSMGFQRDVTRVNAGRERAAAPLAFITPVIGSVAKFGGQFG